MIYYVIKTHYTPTEKNLGAVEHDYYSGKAWFDMNTEHHMGDMSKNKLWICQYTLEHAFKRKCDAVRALKRHIECNEAEEKFGQWKVNSQIIFVEG